jgi:3-hydroxyacyl-[acyl-carrier-protein] dehydratase
MRFLFYDRVVELDKLKSIVGIKTFALSEEFCGRHFSKVPRVPGVILVEAMAQLLGWLICYSYDFRLFGIMTLLEGVEVASELGPGVQAQIRGEVISTTRNDTLGRAWMETAGGQIAVVERIIYKHFHEADPSRLAELFRYYSGLKEISGEPKSQVK